MNKYNFEFSLTTIKEVEKELREKTSSNLFARDQLGFLEEFFGLIVSGKKITTIRFKRGMIDYPAKEIIPVTITNSNSSSQNKEIGWAKILNLRVVPFKDLDEIDAVNDGFSSLEELKKALSKIYGEIENSEFVSIYKFAYSEE